MLCLSRKCVCVREQKWGDVDGNVAVFKVGGCL